jgi:hypothetical protein
MWINVNLTNIVLMFLAIALPMWILTVAVSYFDSDPAYEIRFDCRQASLRIDYPIEVREKCRKIMKKYNEKTIR